jgi:transposase InsO family protein
MFEAQMSFPRVTMLREYWSVDVFKQAQQTDPALSAFCNEDGREVPLLRSHNDAYGDEQKCLRNEKLSLNNGVLHRIPPRDGPQTVVPAASMIPEVLCLAHDHVSSRHQGYKKTLDRVLDRFWWTNVNKDVSNYTRSCRVCAERMTPHQKARAQLRDRPQATRPFDIVEIDIKGPLPRTEKDAQYILFIQDAFSKYVELSSLTRQTTNAVCSKLQDWISRYGLLRAIHSDNGSCFTSYAFAGFCSHNGILHTKSTVYHPQANGAIERFNRSLGEMSAKATNSNRRNWQDYLPQVQLAHNSAYHESIADIPYRIAYKEMPRTLLQAAADLVSPSKERVARSATSYAYKSFVSVPGLYEGVRRNTRKAVEAIKATTI